MDAQKMLTPAAWALLLGLALIWGGSFLSIRTALDEVSPAWVVAHRVSWAALLVWAVVAARGLPVPREPGAWAALAVMGLLNNVVPFGLIAWGQQFIETGLASILNASTAIFGVLVAAIVFSDERLSARRLLGVTVGFLGVVTAIGWDAVSGLDPRSLGQIAILLASLSYAFAGAWGRARLSGLSPQVAAAGMLTASAAMAIPLAWASEGAPDLSLSSRTLGALAYMGLLATGTAYLLYYRLLRAAGSGNALLTTLLVAPIAIVLGAVVLGEALHPSAYAGFALLALGLAILDGRVFAGAARRRAR